MGVVGAMIRGDEQGTGSMGHGMHPGRHIPERTHAPPANIPFEETPDEDHVVEDTHILLRTGHECTPSYEAEEGKGHGSGNSLVAA